ncbi:MAG TPA: hypothetical protein VGO84_01710 [Burkholderiales bacterium]|nr:hypothetical protein [Burkholderiales bacterium]
MSLALLGGGFDCSAAAPDEFDDWYDTEHVPERLRISGFINAVRWIGADNPKISLAIYDLESLDVLQKPEYIAVSPANFSPWAKRMLIDHCTRLCRFNCIQITPGERVAPDNAQGLLVSAMNVAPEAEAEFNEWYEQEHLPSLARIPGVVCARRFTSPGAGHKYVATYHLASPDVCASKAWHDASSTPWTEKMKPHMQDRLRLVLKRYVRTRPLP